MEALYHKTNKLVQVTQGCFERLEVSTEKEAEVLEKEIQARIDTITSNCEKLDILAFKETLAKRQIAKSRVNQLKYDNQHLQAALKGFQHKRYRHELEMQERDELLSRRFNSIKDEETSILIDHSIQHNNALQRANRNLDEIIFTGNNALENLREQRMTLKGAHKKLIDFANTLGLSNTTMRLIENRVRGDKWILIGGMVLTMIVVFSVIIYIRNEAGIGVSFNAKHHKSNFTKKEIKKNSTCIPMKTLHQYALAFLQKLMNQTGVIFDQCVTHSYKCITCPKTNLSVACGVSNINLGIKMQKQ